MSTLYPVGYSTQLVTLEQLRARHQPKMHPEFGRRLFAWIESKGGLVGIGEGWRDTQPDRPGFAPEGKSFHQDQPFASGFRCYAAVDLVCRNPGKVHRAPTWAESADAPPFGLHTFIAGEPWHMQCIEMRGWQTWISDGRPDPQTGFPLPGTPQPQEDAMEFVRVQGDNVSLFVRTGHLVSWVQGPMVAELAARASNTTATARVLTLAQCKAYTLAGPQPWDGTTDLLAGNPAIWGGRV